MARRRHRQSVMFTGEAAELVERLAAERGVSVAEVVRDALSREAWFQDATRRGRILFQPHGEEQPRVVQFVRG
jgi:Ribbon-helix-helix protein, copG family